MKFLSGCLIALFFPVVMLAQNVGINTTNPQATLDVNGSTLLRGANTNFYVAPPQAAVEFFGGRDNAGGLVAGNTLGDIGFNWGGPGGGYRHYISSRHNALANSNTNALDFYINNNANPTASILTGSGFNNGNKHMMSITANGVGVGTLLPAATLHIKGSLLLEDGTQGAGKILTSGPQGCFWADAPVTSPWTRSANATYLINSGDRVGIGTNAPTQALDVVGKLRLRDGTQISGYNLVSDANGVASWTRPDWTKTTNTTTGYYTISPSENFRIVGIGTTAPNANVKLHVQGGFRLDGANTGDFAPNNVLTINAAGNAEWKSMGANPSSYWVPGIYANGNDVIKTNETYSDRAFQSKSQFIVSKFIPGAATGSDDKRNYPLVVEGSETGIAVAVNGESSSSQKYISFFDYGGLGQNFKGAIEGQTLLELQDDPEYIAYVTLQVLSGGSFAAEGIACGFQFDIGEVVVMGIQAAIWAADLGVTIGYLENNVGVNYSSGSADYAEWIERLDVNEKFTYGDIVSVAGGKVSKKINNGGQLMVISRAPIVLGNVPENGKVNNYEKVAFMGQVPVKVVGKVAVGDYIVAFANGSGLGYAVHPSKITVEEMNRIAGVAWSASGKEEISMINTAVGVNTQAANQIIQKQDNRMQVLNEEVDGLKKMVNQLSAYLQSKDSSFKYTALEVNDHLPVAKTSNTQAAGNFTKTNNIAGFAGLNANDAVKRMDNISKEKVIRLLNEKPQYIDAVMKLMKEKMEAADNNVDTNPQFKKLLTDKNYFIEMVKKQFQIN